MPSLSDRLKSLGVKVGAQDLPPPKKRAAYPIEHVIPGEFLDTPHGQAFVVQTRYPRDHRQGIAAVHFHASLQSIAAWAGESRLLECDPGSFIFLDTETSGLAGGTGTYAFLIGVGRLDEDGFNLAQYFMRDPIEEPAQLAALSAFLTTCSSLVTFNGKAFDVPLLHARYTTNGEISPLRATAHVDLLPLARRLWRDRLPSRALSFLEEHILGARRTHEDVPGWLIPGLYFDYLRTGDARPLKSVFYHNAMDILSLAALFSHVTTLLEDPLNNKIEHAVDLIALARLFEDIGQLGLAADLYRRGLESELPLDARAGATHRWSLLEKRRGNFPAAVELWCQAASRGEIYAYVELAKYYEHRALDLQQAAYWTQAALDLVRAPAFPRLERIQLLPELEHRLNRLRRKSSSASGKTAYDV